MSFQQITPETQVNVHMMSSRINVNPHNDVNSLAISQIGDSRHDFSNVQSNVIKNTDPKNILLSANTNTDMQKMQIKNEFEKKKSEFILSLNLMIFKRLYIYSYFFAFVILGLIFTARLNLEFFWCTF